MTNAGEGPPKVLDPSSWLTMSDGARIAYRVKGSGPVLIMVHGWSQSGAMFQHQINHLSDSFTVVVPDLRGHGESPDLGHGLRMARLAKDLDEIVGQLGLARFSLLGWSMGASVLWAYVDMFGTAHVDTFIFVDQPSMLTSMPGMGEAEEQDCGALFTLLSLGDLCAVLKSDTGEESRVGFVRGMVTPHIAPALFEWILAENAKTSLDVAASLLLSHCTNDWRDILPRIDRPALVIAGSVSHVPPRSQQYIHSRIDRSIYREFSVDEGGAHFPFLEAPELFSQVVGDFLHNALADM
jgi:non-heme chloroperoxidase